MKMKNFVRLMIDFSLFGIAPADLNKEADVKCMLFFFFFNDDNARQVYSIIVTYFSGIH